jgi:hypothetical protein
MTNNIVIPNTADIHAAAATVSELETAHRAAQQAAAAAQAHSAALPARLAAGENITTNDLVQAAPLAAVAQAKAAAAGRELAAARDELEQARAAQLADQLRNGAPFMHQDDVDVEIGRITATVQRELGKLGRRIEGHNDALRAAVAQLPKDGSHVFTQDGEGIAVTRHRVHGNTVEMDGREWWNLPTDGWGRDILDRVELAEAQARDAASEPAPRNLTQWEMQAQEQAPAA